MFKRRDEARFDFKQIKIPHRKAKKLAKIMAREAREGWEYIESVKQWTGIVLVFRRLKR